MKFTYFVFLFTLAGFSQTTTRLKIEENLKKIAYQGKFDRLNIDLNADNKEDLIYSYQCGEPKCIAVYLNIDEKYKELINETCTSHSLWETTKGKLLHLELLHCCGESPYISNRVFQFNSFTVLLQENYVLTNETYLENKRLLTPTFYSPHPWEVQILVDNYNLRFSPTIENLENKASFTFGCEDGTNIIGKIKINSKIKVLAEFIEQDRKWLFVEVEKSQLANKNTPLSFDFADQKLRGWISNKFVRTN